ncbi:MAG: pitrilysin family protein [Blastocatellia bacterium]
MRVTPRAALASCLLLGLWVSFGTNRATLTSNEIRPQASSFVLPIVKRDSLLNGLHLITLEQQGTGNVTVRVRSNSGALFDLLGKGGLADITAGMLLKGGGGFGAKEVANTVEQAGLTISVTSGWDSTDIVMAGPADSLDSIFDLLGKLLITPTFDQKDLETLKGTRIAALSLEGRDDAAAVRRKALEVLYGNYPFGHPARGTPESIAQITRPDLVYFHTRFYIANNAELIVSGDVTAAQVTRLARSKLGAWKKGEKIPPTFRLPEAPTGRRIFIFDRSDEQPSRAAIAQIGLSRRAEDYFAAAVMTDVLAKQVSKITEVHPGTTVQSELDARLLAGPLLVTIKSAPADLAGDLEVLLETMTRMQTAPPDSDRVESAKARLIAAMAERLKTTAGAAEVVLDIETYGLGRDYVISFADRVNAITPADVQRAAQIHFKPQSVVIAIAGPPSRFEGAMKKLGSVAVLK